MNSDCEKYICTNCGDHFILTNLVNAEDESVRYGELVCRTCGRRYPVIDAIPRFVSADNYTGSFGYQWNIHSKTQLDSYTGLSISRSRLFAVSGWSEHLEGEEILEAGSGAGRFTEVLLQTGAHVFSFDYSSAVTANQMNNGNNPNLHLFQGDIFNIPFPYYSFNKVICLGVLQHTPDPEMAFRCLASYVKPGGELVIDIYRAGFLAGMQWKYLLRPVTKRINKERLYKYISVAVPILIPITRLMRKFFGRAGARISPIVEYTHLGIPPEVNRDWAILDTFDMYSPVHDHPQSLKTVRCWFSEAGFSNAFVQHGPNGVVGRGKKTSITGSNGG
jgi:SAM-dependent methyltransferase